MTSSQIRQEARSNLSGKWGKGALIILVFLLTMPLIAFIPMASIIIMMPLSYGLIVSFIKLKRGQSVIVQDFLSEAFESIGKVWAVFGNIMAKLLVHLILLVVFSIISGFAGLATIKGSLVGSSSALGTGSFFGTIGTLGCVIVSISLALKSLYYSLSMYVLYDNKELTGKEIVEKSAELMQGNRWNYLWLFISFFGWALLSVLTLGIGFFWLFPYMQVAQIEFYENKVKKANNTNIKTME